MSASLVAEKLKRRREPIEPDEPPPPPKKPAASFAAGDTVLGNFKGFGDWDEALIVGVGADGTYTLEYVDEGLIEEGVLASNIKAADGAGAEAPFLAPTTAAPTFAAGDTVLGNFKGLGDWDEAMIVGVGADGSYTLEYVDEGLIEEGVPAERITAADGAGADSAALALGGALATEEDGEEEEEEDDDDDDDEADNGAEFIASRRWTGPRPGYLFTTKAQGVGYYKDVPLLTRHEEAQRAAMRFTAPTLANWALEQLRAPPSVKKVDRYMELHNLDALRVHALGSDDKPALFGSLGAWFDALKPLLAGAVSEDAVGVTLRCFLEPQQTLRQGLEHVTFSVDWLSVACDDEPLSGALLGQMGLAGRRPKRMRLVVMYRVERNQITNVWADIDREGLGAKKGASLDDVLVSDVFDRALTLARRGGAIGELTPVVNNYHDIETIGG